jgi:hypothetical protein
MRDLLSNNRIADNRIAAIADKRYKEIDVDDHPPSEHTMQMHSYSSITEAKKCILIYTASKNLDKRDYPSLEVLL